MKILIIGITGAVGRLLTRALHARGDTVHGLVRTDDQQAGLAAEGTTATVGDLASMSVAELASVAAGADAVVFSAGSNGGSREVTRAVDGDGVAKVVQAAGLAGVDRFVLVSVFPESWRERDLGDDVEYYFAVKKEADVALTRSGQDWLVVRPSLLIDGPGAGTVSLGPAALHHQIARADVAETLAELLHEPRIGRQILELDTGPTPIADAVQANVRPC